MSGTATCGCGQLTATVTGEPVRVSVCHCTACQQRSGSAFAWQARWPEEQVTIAGEANSWQRTGDEGGVATFSFCPHCGGNVFYVASGLPGLIAIPMGGFAGQDRPPPEYSVYESRKQPWLELIGDGIEHW